MLALLFLSLGLAMDAFAVSMARGAAGEQRLARAMELGILFGLAQGLMPLLGWFLGFLFTDTFKSFDHWIAFMLLTGLGWRMLVEANAADEKAEVGSHGRWIGLLIAAFATSIDAAAAGLTLPLLAASIPVACIAIAATTASLCTLGYMIGAQASCQVGKAAEIMGGVILIALGAKVLIEHLTA
jgi:manganese efflux pump family protein